MGALDGLRVVEAGLLVQGPQAAATLGEWGADVVKVELPGFGDQSRWLPVAPGKQSAYFVGCNRGKRSITVDLRRPPGKEVFLRLVERSDVVISNFKPGTMEAWGLGYEEMSARNRRVVVGFGSTFGPVGPDAGREGADLSAQAAGGSYPRPVSTAVSRPRLERQLPTTSPARTWSRGCSLPSWPGSGPVAVKGLTRLFWEDRSGPRPVSTPPFS